MESTVLRSGKLREKIVIQTVSEAQNAVGEPIDTWTTFAVRRASVEPLNGREYFLSEQVNADVSIRFRLRYLKNITTKMRVSYSGRVFDIISVINTLERDKETILMCREDV